LRALNNLVEQYLIFAESQAERRMPMTMRDWITKLEGFLTLNDREICRMLARYQPNLPRLMLKNSTKSFTGRKIGCWNRTLT